ncbi:MAG: class I SAM-dependent methyltransferase [Miltoncostaeaceae bacterium]
MSDAAAPTVAPAQERMDEIRARVAGGEPLVGQLRTDFFAAAHALDPTATEDSLAVLPGNRGVEIYSSLLQWAPLVGGERVLDVGCGSGGAARAAAAIVGEKGRVMGVDTCREALAEASERTAAGAPVSFRRSNAQSMPFLDDRAFDCAVASLVLEEIDDLPAAIAEVTRVLRPGGRFVASVMAFDRLRPMDAAFMGSVLAVVGRRAPGALAGRASRASVPDEPADKAAFADAGLNTVEEQDVQLAAVMEDADDAWRIFSRTHIAYLLDEEGRADLREVLARRLPHTVYLPVRFLRTRRPG